MKRILCILLWLGQLPALASQIVVGLRSDNLLSWGVWEREGNTLQHYLLLYNKSSQPLDISIRAVAFCSSDPAFLAAATHQVVRRQRIAPQQLVRLRYPTSQGRPGLLELLEYVENKASVGLLTINSSRPDAAALTGEAYRFYTKEGANGQEQRYWLAFNSLYTPPAYLLLQATTDEFRSPVPFRRGEKSYSLAKLYPSAGEAPAQSGTLDSLFTAGRDPAICRLDSTHRRALVPVSPAAPTTQLRVFMLLIENVELFFRYNEQRQLVMGKSVSGSGCLIPFFPQKPE